MLLVQGDNRPGLGHAIAQAIAEAGIKLTWLTVQVIDTRFSAVIGFASEAASKQATLLIKKAVKLVEKQFVPPPPTRTPPARRRLDAAGYSFFVERNAMP